MIPQDSIPSFIVISLFMLLMVGFSVAFFVRTWKIRKDLARDFKGHLEDIRSWWPGVRDRFRAWHDAEFRKRWLAFGDYNHSIEVIQKLRERAVQHYVRSEQSSFDHVRRHHAALHVVIEKKIPDVAEGMAYYIAGMTDEEIGFVAEGLSKMMVNPKLVRVPESDRIPIGPDRFVEFLRSERALLLDRPRMMETHANRLAEFIYLEAEAVHEARERPEACDAHAT